MAMVSGKYRIAFGASLLSALISGCVAQLPVRSAAEGAGTAAGLQVEGTGMAAERQAEAAGTARTQAGKPPVVSVDDGAENQRALELASGSVPLPQQSYDARGVKIPYVPQPNPYTSSKVAVPGEARAMFVAASARLAEGNLSSARNKFEQLAERYPDLSGPWVKLGEIAGREGNLDEAVGHYRHAISLNRDNVNAYIALGMAQRKQGRFNDAQETYLAALDVWRDFPEAHLNLAILYDLYGNQPEAAQRHYEAYDFLTGGKDEKSRKWLVEVRQRTGIERSFIDTPPVVVEVVPADRADGNSVAAKNP